jgi:hypothetical protein
MKTDIMKLNKKRVLGVLQQHRTPENAIEESELGSESFLGYSRLRETIFELAVNDKFHIKMTGFPVKFYLDG